VRHGFLAFSEIHPDYFRIPVGDRGAVDGEDAGPESEVPEGEAEEALVPLAEVLPEPVAVPEADGGQEDGVEVEAEQSAETRPGETKPGIDERASAAGRDQDRPEETPEEMRHETHPSEPTGENTA